MVNVGMRVDHIGTSSLRYAIALFADDADIAAAQGHFVHVYVDRASNRPVPIPDAVRAAVLPFVADLEPNKETQRHAAKATRPLVRPRSRTLIFYDLATSPTLPRKRIMVSRSRSCRDAIGANPEQIAARHQTHQGIVGTAENGHATDGGGGHAIGQMPDQLVVKAGDQIAISQLLAKSLAGFITFDLPAQHIGPRHHWQPSRLGHRSPDSFCAGAARSDAVKNLTTSPIDVSAVKLSAGVA